MKAFLFLVVSVFIFVMAGMYLPTVEVPAFKSDLMHYL